MEGISNLDKVFVNGENGPVSVLQHHNDMERTLLLCTGSASYSSSGNISLLAMRSETTDCAQDGEHNADPWAHVHISWNLLSLHSATPDSGTQVFSTSVSKFQPMDQPIPSTTAVVQH